MSGVLALRRAGWSYKEIARWFGVSPNAVSWWLQNGFPAARRAQLRQAIRHAIERNNAILAEIEREEVADAAEMGADGVGMAPRATELDLKP